MSTKFVQATNKVTGQKTAAHDTDSPFLLFKEINEQNQQNGQTMKDWKFDLLNYKGDRLGVYKWKQERVTVNLGDLFS